MRPLNCCHVVGDEASFSLFFCRPLLFIDWSHSYNSPVSCIRVSCIFSEPFHKFAVVRTNQPKVSNDVLEQEGVYDLHQGRPKRFEEPF